MALHCAPPAPQQVVSSTGLRLRSEPGRLAEPSHECYSVRACAEMGFVSSAGTCPVSVS
jgi:hypothetical protein